MVNVFVLKFDSFLLFIITLLFAYISNEKVYDLCGEKLCESG